MKIHLFLGTNNKDMENIYYSYKENLTSWVWPECGLIAQTQKELAERTEIVVEATLKDNIDLGIMTHSESVFNRIRLMVVQDKLKSEDVIINWIEGDSIKNLKICRSGSLSSWPSGLFDHNLNEIGNILRARKK